MNTRSLLAAGLAASLALSLPTLALSKDHGNQGGGRGQSSEGKGRSQERRGDERQRSEPSVRANRGSERQAPARVERAPRQEERRAWQPQGRVGRTPRGVEGRAYQPQPERRSRTWTTDPRQVIDRDPTGRRAYAGGDNRRYRPGDGDFRHRTSYGTRYRYYGSYRNHYRPHYYYTGYFSSRPRYAYRSDFSIGLSIGFAPTYGYRYFDPYCRSYYRSLNSYYDHCWEYDHPEAILVYGGGSPVATCVYEDGDWVVDDCGEDY